MSCRCVGFAANQLLLVEGFVGDLNSIVCHDIFSVMLARTQVKGAQGETQAEPRERASLFPYLPNRRMIRYLLVRGRSIGEDTAPGIQGFCRCSRQKRKLPNWGIQQEGAGAGMGSLGYATCTSETITGLLFFLSHKH